jgi:hypothetical protein
MTNTTTTPPIDLCTPWSLHFGRDGTGNYAAIRNDEGADLVRCEHFGLCDSDDPLPATLEALRLMTAAPKLLKACKLALAAMQTELEADDPQAATQMEWEAEPLATLREAIAEAETVA